MTTAVVVTSIVTTNLGEARFVDHLLKQIRRNDKQLLNKLNAVDGDARIVTAILNVGEFMSYAQEYLRNREEAVVTQAKPLNGISKPDAHKTTVVTADMDELEFMAYTLEQLRQGSPPTSVKLGAEALEAIEEEKIGEDFSCQPFVY